MLSTIIYYCIALACVLAVVSLPLGKTAIAGTLRRLAGALFLLALAPSLFFGIFASPSGSGGGAATANPLAVLGGIVLLAVLSYAILAVRKRLTKTSKDAWSEFVSLRSSGKRPVGTDPRPNHAPSLFDEEEP